MRLSLKSFFRNGFHGNGFKVNPAEVQPVLVDDWSVCGAYHIMSITMAPGYARRLTGTSSCEETHGNKLTLYSTVTTREDRITLVCSFLHLLSPPSVVGPANQDHGNTNNRPAYFRRQTVFFLYKIAAQIFAAVFFLVFVTGQ